MEITNRVKFKLLLRRLVALDIRQIANELGVRYIVEGSVRRSTSRVRINAQLFDATSNTHVWTDRLDRNLTDVFQLQDEVVNPSYG